MKKIGVPSLNVTIHSLEDSIITLSGPALAISGIIAGVDLVTGGNMLKSVGWLALAWAICLLLTLDFQVLALGARAHRVYLSNKPINRKVFEIILAVVIACAISYVSIQMQSIIARSNSVTPTLSIDAATIQMGINPIALIWERSSLVLILIFLSGWFREDDTDLAIDSSIAIATPDSATIKSEIEQTVSAALAVALERINQANQQQFDIVLQEVKRTVIEEVTQQRLIAMPREIDSSTASIIDSNLAKRKLTKTATLTSPVDSRTARFATIKKALIDSPHITDKSLADLANCSINTVRKDKQAALQELANAPL
jgi:hypothetical protein